MAEDQSADHVALSADRSVIIPGARRLPDFLHIGPSKAGSTWIFKALTWHPQIYTYAGKNLDFFSTRFDQGWDWYIDQFDPQPHHRVVGEVSHSYLVSPDAAEHIHQHLPHAKLIMCLREPVQRLFSDYLDGIKNGKMHGTLDEALEQYPSLINKSRYGTPLARYLDRFDRRQIHVGSFDELVTAPNRFAAKLFEFLGVDALELPENLLGKLLPAGTPRVRPIATAAKAISKLAGELGLRSLRGKLKTSRTVRNLIYRPYSDGTRPTISPDTEARLRGLMADEVQRLDRLAGTDFARLWNYPSPESD